MNNIFSWLWKLPLTVATVEIVAIMAVAVVAQFGLRLLLHRFHGYLIYSAAGTPATKQARADTLTGVMSKAATSVIWLVAILMILDTIGVSIAPLIAGAGVLGLAISFGAQELIRDGFTGFFFLLENQFNVGSYLEIGGLKGVVIQMDLRTVTLRNEETKAIYIFRNSQIGVICRFDPETDTMVTVKTSKSTVAAHA